MSEITFIVPIYNVESYVFKCLESIEKQTNTDFEVLCVNDGSTDKSRDIILEFVDKDKRFKLLDKKNGGLSDARNYGLEFVSTKYVAFIDGDDSIEPYYLEKALPRVKEDDLDILVFSYNQFNLEKNNKEKTSLMIKDGTYTLKENKEVLAYCPNSAWTKIYKTSLFKDNRITYPYGYRHQDLGTTAKLLLRANKVGFMNEALYNYIVDRPNNITTQIDEKLYHIVDMLKEIFDYYKDNNCFDDYKNEFYYLGYINAKQSLRKAVTLKDKDFVNKFIDDVFAFLNSYLKGAKDIYGINEVRDDVVYTNKTLCKLYYSFKNRRSK